MGKSLMEFIESDDVDMINTAKINKENTKEIAIIGIGLKLPMSDTIDEFVHNLSEGKNLTTEITEERKADIEKYFTLKGIPKGNYQFEKAAYLEDISSFDYGIFHLSPNEAALMDPSQRLFLETAWKAIDDGGYGGEKISGSKTSVYVGFTNESQYKQMILEIDPQYYSLAVPGNLPSVIAGRISYLLDLKGASMVVDTACSSSLTAVYLACRALRSGDCDMAIAGGIQLHVLPIRYAKLGIESSDNKTKTFDNSSDGTGGGEGAAAILLKPLHKALRDGDNIYAVIKGSACNQDGATMSLSAPSPEAQEEVITSAWQDAGIDPETITYIEAHGTGTKLGDPIEIEGLRRAFSRYTHKKQFCAVSSVKSNLGHLDAASGIVGLIKAVLSIKYKKLFPSLYFERPNRNIAFHKTAVYVNNQLMDWECEEGPRRCGVSSFSFSGTNCHLVLEEAPVMECHDTIEFYKYNILTVSARTEKSLIKLLKSYQSFAFNKETIRDLCYTANTGRKHYNYRIALVFLNISDLINQINKLVCSGLKTWNRQGIFYGVVNSTKEEGLSEEWYSNLKVEETQENNLLNKFGFFYVSGSQIDWNKLYFGENRHKLSIPVYSFEKNRCWVNIPEIETQEYYTNIWKKCAVPESCIRHNSVMILGADTTVGKRIISEMLKDTVDIVEVYLGEQNACISDRKYMISAEGEAYNMLAGIIKTKKVTQIINVMATEDYFEITDVNELEHRLFKGVYGLFYMIVNLLKIDRNEKLDMVLVTMRAESIHAGDRCLHPEYAVMSGLGKVINIECYQYTCRMVDLDEKASILQLIREVNTEYADFNVAYRNDVRYVKEMDKVVLSPKSSSTLFYQQNGVYIITGGTGGLGLEIAIFLSTKGCKNIALISRRGFPTEEVLNQKSYKESRHHAEIIKRIRCIEENGTLVLHYPADVSKEEEIQNVLKQIRCRFGKINGVIHCAGIGVGFEGKKLKEERMSSFKTVMSPKVQGTWLLHKLTEQDVLDFFVVLTSPITITGGIGSGSYTAANSYLDSFTAFRNGIGKKTIAISLAPWEKTIKRTNKDIDSSKHFFNVLMTEEFLSAFEKIINSDMEYVIAGKLNKEAESFELQSILPFRLSKNIMQELYHNKEEHKSWKQVFHVHLYGRDENRYEKSEEYVAQAFGNILGYKEINILENFYEIGGDSILAIRVINFIYENYGIDVKITNLLRNPILEDFSKYVWDGITKVESDTKKHEEIQVIENRKYYPVSMSQKRILALTGIKNIDLSWNMSWVWKVEGDLNLIKLSKVFNELVKKYEILRTTFEFIKGEAVQLVHKSYDFRIEQLKSTGCETVDNFFFPYDLSRLPLMRCGYMECSNGENFLIFDIHHIISDASSVQILFKDLVSFYQGNLEQKNILQYKDYTLWQNDVQNSMEMKKQENYWKNRLSNMPLRLDIPTDYVRPAIRKNMGEKIFFEADQKELSKLHKISVNLGCSLFTVLVAIYGILAWKLSGQEDIIIGIPISGRENRQTENMVGMFINVVALRCFIKGNKTFSELVAEIHQEFLEVSDNSTYPFSELVQNLGILQEAGRNPIFDISFVMQNTGNSETLLDKGIRLIPMQYDHKYARNDLLLEAIEENDKLRFILEYSSELFSKETAEQYICYFKAIIEEVTKNESIQLYNIKTMGEEEQILLINDFLSDM